jgi:tetratricopeptide (TPR) repeat protein
MNLGLELFLGGKLREAGAIFISVARLALKIYPVASQDAYNSLGAVLAAMAEAAGHQQPLLQYSAAAFHASLAANPARCYGPAHHNIGIAAAKALRWEPAMAAYRAALQCEPSNPDYHYSLGAAHLAAADPPPLALESFRAACAAGPGSADAFLGLGYALRDAGRPRAAAAAFATARRLAAATPTPRAADSGRRPRHACGGAESRAALGEFAALAHAAAFDRLPPASARARACLLPGGGGGDGNSDGPAAANLYELARIAGPADLLRLATARAAALLRAAAAAPGGRPLRPPPPPPAGGPLEVAVVSAALGGDHYIGLGLRRLLRYLARPAAPGPPAPTLSAHT